MTAGEVATGLGRASVSATLSKLAKSGDVIKAARSCRRAGQTAAGAPADAAESAESDQSAGVSRGPEGLRAGSQVPAANPAGAARA